MKNNPEYWFYGRKKIWVLVSVIAALVYVFFSVRISGNGSVLILILPPALLLAVLLFISLERFLLLTVFLVPLSVQLRFLVPDPPFDIFLPTELMLLASLVLIVYRFFVTRDFNRNILRHPVSVMVYCLLAWVFLTSLTSSMPLVSFKNLAARLWYIASFYFLAAEIFRDHRKIRKYFLAYTAGMTPVVIYFLVRMYQSGIFNQEAAYGSPQPFFLDHTAIGAGLAFLIPMIVYFLLSRDSSLALRSLLAIQLLLFTAAFILSYSRAAWISLVFAGMITLVFLSRLSWKVILTGTTVILIVIITSWSEIIIRLNENRQESSADMASHIRSIANIRSDASNMERINRWKAALRMSAERPLLGWGPGTYQFNYAPFQVSTEKTIISTNYGEGGNAHSEYLGSLSESGIPGMVFYILLLFFMMQRGVAAWKHHPDRSTRYLTLSLMAGLVTYIIHGGLNNFLDSDKISALFWGMIAAIVAIDVEMKEYETGKSMPQIGSDN